MLDVPSAFPRWRLSSSFWCILLSLGVGVNVLCYNTMLCWTVAGSKHPSNQLLPLKKINARKPPCWEVTLCVGRLVSVAC